VEYRRQAAEHNILEIARIFCKEWALSHLFRNEYAVIDEQVVLLVVESTARKAVSVQMQKPLKLMIVAGEASGDSHGAELVREIREIEPDALFFGSAGPKMRAAGVEAIVEADSLSVVGIGAVARSVPMFLDVLQRLKREARKRKPNAVILADFPEFNLKLARSLKKQGLYVIYYISPQIWAWRKYRIRTIRRYVDLVISILPFEKAWYASQGVDHVVNVRNPLVGKVRASMSRSEFCLKYELDPAQPIVALLPGSRGREVARILPEMLEAASGMAKTDPAIQFVVALAPHRSVEEVNSLQKNAPQRLIYVQSETYEVLNASDAAAVTSGTATLEAAILGTPMVVVYKVPRLDYQLLKRFVNVPHIGLVNLVVGERVAKELVQDEFRSRALAVELHRLLDPKENAAMREKLRQVNERLSENENESTAGKVILDSLRSL
jgi:lipid-A-disaccharide synthase